MTVDRSGFTPNQFVLKRGVPVKWVIDGKELTSCNSAIQVPSMNLEFKVKPGLQTIEFTPEKAGTIRWSCWMGMLQGSFTITDDPTDPSAVQDVQNTAQAEPSPLGGSCGMAGGSCGCGGS